MRWDVQDFRVDEHDVKLTRIPVRRHSFSTGTRSRKADSGCAEKPEGDPKERVLYEIRIDGLHVALAYRNHGFGRQPWGIDRLCPQYTHIGILRGLSVLPEGHVSHEDRLWDMDSVARTAVSLRGRKDSGGLARLSAENEIHAWVKRYRAEQAREKRESRARHDRWRAES